jgi:[NiFe] hydrogenase diaphorase moiety large subunit
MGIHRADVLDAVSFYSFFRRQGQGHASIRIPRCPACSAFESEQLAEKFKKTLGIKMGSTTSDSRFSLQWTSCIGLCDQGPAILVNGSVFTRLSPEKVDSITNKLKTTGILDHGQEFPQIQNACGPNSKVDSNIILPGPVFFQPIQKGAGLWKALSGSPERVIDEICSSRLRGRGGAGFPTANKWNLTRYSRNTAQRVVVGNADEGEPGTFKDRVLLSEAADLVFEGMTIAGYAIGAQEGIFYLRAEYAWLWPHLNEIITKRRTQHLLGDHVCGHENFHFDIRIQLGAGAYICGEETALLESSEGKRGAPRDRPPYPTDAGYLGKPTAVNNVETLACVTRILEKGSKWFTQYGTKDSAGTKLFSVSGDCDRPGIFEVPLGITVYDLLALAGAINSAAVMVSGPSGEIIGPKDFGRKLCHEDLRAGGSIMVFGQQRDLLAIVQEFQKFFSEESCGYCTPCRAGTPILETMFAKIVEGRGTHGDWEELLDFAGTVKRTSRCGLGQSAANPIVSTSRNFPELYQTRLQAVDFTSRVSLDEALADARQIMEKQI